MAEAGSGGLLVGAIAGVIALGIGIALFKKPAATSSPKTSLPELPAFTPEEASTAASFAPAAAAPMETTPAPAPAQAAAPAPAAPPIYVDFTYQPPSQSKPVYRAGE